LHPVWDKLLQTRPSFHWHHCGRQCCRLSSCSTWDQGIESDQDVYFDCSSASEHFSKNTFLCSNERHLTLPQSAFDLMTMALFGMLSLSGVQSVCVSRDTIILHNFVLHVVVEFQNCCYSTPISIAAAFHVVQHELSACWKDGWYFDWRVLHSKNLL
jgi:hypothetical protein